MAFKNRSSDQHSFQGDNNYQSGNEFGSGNRFFFNFDGTPVVMLVGFILTLASGVIIWMIIVHAALMALIALVGFVLIAVVGIGAVTLIIVCLIAKHLSHTWSQLQVDRHREMWAANVYPVGSHIVVRDPRFVVHNARDIIENRHYDQYSELEGDEESEVETPSLLDLAINALEKEKR